MKSSPQTSEGQIPFGRMTKFVRQLMHDVRNGLSAIDLEAAFIAEIVADPEAADEVRKLRIMVANTAQMLKDISQNFQPVTAHTMPWQAGTFFTELCARLGKEFPDDAASVQTEARVEDELIDVDLEQLISVIFSVLRNSFQFRLNATSVQLSIFPEPADGKKKIVIEVCEPKPDLTSAIPPEEWGLEPLRTTRPGGYGLGLYRAREILSAQGGELETHYSNGVLVTRIVLPVYVA